MADRPSTRKLATILFSDMVGYSALVGRDEKLAFRLLERQKKLVRSVLPKFAGREVEVIGDAFLVEFDSAQHGVQCALALQQRLASLAPEQVTDPPTLLRIALHLGDIERPGNKVYGDTVNIAARLQEFAPPGGIALSGQVHSQVEGRVALPFQSIGRPALKNITRSVEIFTVDAAAVQAAPQQDDATSPRSTRPRRLAGALAAAAALFASIGGGWYFVATRPAAAPVTTAASSSAEDDRSIAVMPLRNVSNDASYEYFSDGLSEELINALAQIHGLRVIGRSSSFQFKNKNDDAGAIGARLHVGHLLEGSVRREGGRVRVVAELVKCSDGAAVWTQSYDRNMKDVLGVQEEIANAVALQLKARLMTDSKAVADDRPPNGDLAAYEAYLKGNFLKARAVDAEGMAPAVKEYREALRLQPDYALAQAHLSLALTQIGNWGSGRTRAREYEEARKWAHQAVALAPRLADPHVALASVLLSHDWKPAEAEPEIRVALDINPGDVAALDQLSLLLSALGRGQEALEIDLRGAKLDPLNPDLLQGVVFESANNGNYEQAEQYLQRFHEIQPDPDLLHFYASYIALLRGQGALALSEARATQDPRTRALTEALALAAGPREESDAALQRLIAGYSDDLAYQVADVYAIRGEADRVFEWLERAYGIRDSGVLYLLSDPFMKPFRTDPRFAAMCKKVGLPVPPTPVHG